MIFKQLLLLSVPSGCLVWAAQQPANFAQVVGRLNGLEDSASQGNADVSGVNAVNGLTTEPSVRRISSRAEWNSLSNEC